MNRTCIVVADIRLARVYCTEAVDSPRVKMKLVEQASLSNPGANLKALGRSTSGRTRTETNTNREAGPMHPIGAQRERHRLELDRRFCQEIARETAAVTKEWNGGAVVLVAEPRQLGLMREPLRHVLHQGIELKELAKDLTNLTPAELCKRLTLGSLLPARRGGVQ